MLPPLQRAVRSFVRSQARFLALSFASQLADSLLWPTSARRVRIWLETIFVNCSSWLWSESERAKKLGAIVRAPATRCQQASARSRINLRANIITPPDESEHFPQATAPSVHPSASVSALCAKWKHPFQGNSSIKCSDCALLCRHLKTCRSAEAKAACC